MGHFTTDLITKRLDARWVQLEKPLIYEWPVIIGDLCYREFIFVPAGFITDYATAPWGLQNTFNRKGKMGLAGIVHDWLYFIETGTRKEADQLFHKICREQGLGRIRAGLAYWGVRIGAGRHWGGKDDTMCINGVWSTLRGGHWMPFTREQFTDRKG